MKKWILRFVLIVGLLSPIIFSIATVSAAGGCPSGYRMGTDKEGNKTCIYYEDCAAQDMVELKDDGPNKGGKFVCCPPGHNTDALDCVMAKYINPTISLLATLAGVVAVFGIAMGGIQYASSGGDPQKVAAGKSKITKSLLGIVAFMFLFSALQFLSPGGFSNTGKVPSGSKASADACAKEFFTLKPWFAYLPDENFDGNCQIVDFNIFPAEDNPSDVVPVVLAIVDNLVRIAALVAVAFVVVGGAKYVTSQGEPEGTKSAKDSIINAMIGLVVAIVAASVVAFIGNQLT